MWLLFHNDFKQKLYKAYTVHYAYDQHAHIKSANIHTYTLKMRLYVHLIKKYKLHVHLPVIIKTLLQNPTHTCSSINTMIQV